MLELDRCMLTGNSAYFGGGALFNDGTTTVVRSTFHANTTAGTGSAIFNNSGTLTHENSVLGGGNTGAADLAISGAAALGGTHEVKWINGYTIAGGESFNLFDGTLAGGFAQLDRSALSGGLTWDTSRLATEGILAVSPALTGLQAWRLARFGASGKTGNGADASDFDGDGLANLLEYAFGLDPTSAASRQLPAARLEDGMLFYDFDAPEGVAGVTYGAEWSTTLQAGSWTPLSNAGTPPHYLFGLSRGSQPRLFIRLRVTGE